MSIEPLLRPQQIVEDTLQLFLKVDANTVQLLDAKTKSLTSLRSTLKYLRILTVEHNIEEVPSIFEDVREAIKILESDVKL